MSKELKLSDIREWTGELEAYERRAEIYILRAKNNRLPLGLLRDDSPIIAAILRKAPHEYVQRYYEDGIDLDTGESKGRWAACGVASCRSAHFTYCLRDGVTVVDDTAEDGEYEFVEVERGGSSWGFHLGHHVGSAFISLEQAVSDTRYICTEVEDARGLVCYLDCWHGPHPRNVKMYESINDLVCNKRWLPFGSVSTPLTPKRVVFRREGD